MVLNFYQTLVHKKEDLLGRVKDELSEDGIKDRIKDYRANLVTVREAVKKDEDYKKQIRVWVDDNDSPSLPTYPFRRSDVKIREAFQYLFVSLDDNGFDLSHCDAQDRIIKFLERLSSRLKNAYFCWVKPEKLFKVIANPRMSIVALKNEGDGTKNKLQVKHSVECNSYSKWKFASNKEKGTTEKVLKTAADRTKKGFFFYDFILDSSMGNAEKFVKFIKGGNSDCLWVFVCKKGDINCIDMFKGIKTDNGGNSVQIIYASNKLMGYGGFLSFAVDTVIITNAATDAFMTFTTIHAEGCYLPAVKSRKIDELLGFCKNTDSPMLIKPIDIEVMDDEF
jgi:hypothetical protein